MAKKKPNETAENAQQQQQQQQSKKMNKKDLTYVVRNKEARKQTNRRRMTRVIAIVIIILLLLAALLYGVYTWVNINSFKIYVDSNHGKLFTLSNTSDFQTFGEVLEVSGPATMDNTTLAMGFSNVKEPTIEENLLEIATSDGYNGPKDVSYICSTFYLKNITREDQVYYEVVKINSVTKGIEKTLRIMLIKNYEIEIFAKSQSSIDPDTQEETLSLEKVVPLKHQNYVERYFEMNADGEYQLKTVDNDVAWMTKDFYNQDYAIYRESNIAADEIIKYTIIVWIEGWDDDTTTEKVGGIVNMDFMFTSEGFPVSNEQNNNNSQNEEHAVPVDEQNNDQQEEQEN